MELKRSRSIRKVAAVLAVLFFLTSIWAGYFAVATTSAASAKATTVPVATYQVFATNGFVADLRPSALYNNSTELTGGNVTLFSALTTWVNASLSWSLEVNRSATIQLQDSFEVVLSSSVWSKVLWSQSNSTNRSGTTLVTLTERYDVNVTTVLALAAEIGAETRYPSVVYTLSLRPEIVGTIAAGGSIEPISSLPLLNMTFDGPLINPGGLSYSDSGVLEKASPSAADDPPGGAAVPYLLLALSVSAFGVSTWFAARRPEGETVPPLAQLIAPYEEAIAETAETPEADVTIPVSQFADLVKIADTLGKPILRPSGTGPDRPAFFVSDGEVAYLFRYPGRFGERGGGSASGAPGSPRPTKSSSSETLVARLRLESDRIRDLALDPGTSDDVRRRVKRAIVLIHEGKGTEASLEIDQLSQVLSLAELRNRRS